LRVESPGSDQATWQLLAQRGGFDEALTDGQWRPGRAFFLGLQRALADITAATPQLTPTHPAQHILTMTDKLWCAQHLQQHRIATPQTDEAPTSVEALRTLLMQQRRHAVFVKPRWGSSAAGVMAYRFRPQQEQLITTARLIDGKLVNEKCLHVYRDSASISVLLQTILSDGAIVQTWIPKAATEGGPFDVRVLMIAGQLAQRVARVGNGAITNLHINAKRMSAEQALDSVGKHVASRVYSVCQQVADSFPGQLVLGIDVMVDAAGRPFVIECNAWGDYLPKLLLHGQDSYDSQVHAMFGTAA
jgi:glutathione synthase/RimK-type ligase-like ATP-grasp enzyme